MHDPDVHHDDASDLRRQRQMRRSAWLAVAALYIVVAISAAIITTRFGVAPDRDDDDRAHAEHVAELTFVSLYNLMLHGAGRAELHAAALRLETTGPGLSIHFVRGPRVTAQFGELRSSTILTESDPLVSSAFATGKAQWENDQGSRRVAYPARFRGTCASCHEGARNDEVAGVILIDLGATDNRDDALSTMLPLGVFLLLGLPATLLTVLLISGTPGRGKK